MSQVPHPIIKLLQEDPRYRLEAYEFVRDALSYAHEGLKSDESPSTDSEPSSSEEETPPERHLTGQQLCEAIRLYAMQQYGYMAKVVLNSWGLNSTSDFGDIVYNLIEIGMMKKSEDDHREDFDHIYDFEEAFQKLYKIESPN